MLHVCIYKMHNMIRFFCTKVKFHIKCLFWNQASLLKGTHDLYFELMKVLGISLSCLLHDGFHGCVFLFRCMLRGSVGQVSGLNIIL